MVGTSLSYFYAKKQITNKCCMTNLWLVLNFVFGSFAFVSFIPIRLFVFLYKCLFVYLFVCLFFHQIPFAPTSPSPPHSPPSPSPSSPSPPTLLPLSHFFTLFFCFLISSVSLIVREVIFFFFCL